jgi:hypothetical protein
MPLANVLRIWGCAISPKKLKKLLLIKAIQASGCDF